MMGLENLPEKIVGGLREKEKDIPLLEVKATTNNNAAETKVSSFF